MRGAQSPGTGVDSSGQFGSLQGVPGPVLTPDTSAPAAAGPDRSEGAEAGLAAARTWQWQQQLLLTWAAAGVSDTVRTDGAAGPTPSTVDAVDSERQDVGMQELTGLA